MLIENNGDELLSQKRAAMVITPIQLFVALASPPFNFISQEEAVLAATTGAIPSLVEAAITSLPPADEMIARIKWARMSVVLRLDPMVMLLASATGTTEEEIDTFFEFAGNLS